MIKPLHFTFDKYMDIVAAGVFENDKLRVELIEGAILEMNPIGPQHCELVRRLTQWSYGVAASDRWSIWVQQPIAIPDSDSAPEPDLAWVQTQSYHQRYPICDEVGLLIEVCYSSQAYDRGEKSRIYAAAGMSDYWIVDAMESNIEVRREPSGDEFQSVSRFVPGDTISPLCQSDAILNLSDIF